MGNQGSKLYKLLETTSVGELIESKQGKIVMVTCNNTLNEAITVSIFIKFATFSKAERIG